MPPVDLNPEDSYGRTPLLIAYSLSVSLNYQVIAPLLNNGAIAAVHQSQGTTSDLFNRLKKLESCTIFHCLQQVPQGARSY